MRADLGFILIGLGLVGAYIALGGKFSKSSGSSKPGGAASGGLAAIGGVNGSNAPGYSAPFKSNPTPVQGGASQPANVPNLSTNPNVHGSGGESWQSRITQLGHVLALQANDRHASKGGFR